MRRKNLRTIPQRVRVLLTTKNQMRKRKRGKKKKTVK